MTAYRDPVEAPLRKLSVDLIKTYKNINEVRDSFFHRSRSDQSRSEISKEIRVSLSFLLDAETLRQEKGAHHRTKMLSSERHAFSYL